LLNIQIPLLIIGAFQFFGAGLECAKTRAQQDRNRKRRHIEIAKLVEPIQILLLRGAPSWKIGGKELHFGRIKLDKTCQSPHEFTLLEAKGAYAIPTGGRSLFWVHSESSFFWSYITVAG